MTPPLYAATDVGPATDPAAPLALAARFAVSPALARTTLVTAVLLGAAADALMHDGPQGIGFTLWIASLAVNATALFSRDRRSPPREALLWLVAAVTFSLGFAWRNSDPLLALDFLATLFSLGMAAVSVRDPRAALFARRASHTVRTALDVVANTFAGVLPLAFREARLDDPGEHALSRSRFLVRPALITVAALIVFGSLLRGADPIFASLTNLPSIDLSGLVSHVVVAAFFAWIFAGWARGSLVENATPHRSAAPFPIQLGRADVVAALGTLGVLFAAFIATQIGWLFGGEAFLRARTGLTAAAYARQGFFEMVWVVVLVVPVLVGTRAALAPDRGLARLHTAMSLPVVLLLGAIIGSAMLRMNMYVHYFGLTTERFYPTVFMLWLATVVVWLAITVLRDWSRPFVGGAVLSGMAFLFGLNVVDPDAIVARVNLSRAEHTAPGAEPGLDLVHLASLRGRGTAMAVDAVVHADVGGTAPTDANSPAARQCTAARILVDRWTPRSSARPRAERRGGWRYWNHDDAAAFRAVDARRADLERLASGGCTTAKERD